MPPGLLLLRLSPPLHVHNPRTLRRLQVHPAPDPGGSGPHPRAGHHPPRPQSEPGAGQGGCTGIERAPQRRCGKMSAADSHHTSGTAQLRQYILCLSVQPRPAHPPCPVQPANTFIDSQGIVKLGDFGELGGRGGRVQNRTKGDGCWAAACSGWAGPQAANRCPTSLRKHTASPCCPSQQSLLSHRPPCRLGQVQHRGRCGGRRALPTHPLRRRRCTWGRGRQRSAAQRHHRPRGHQLLHLVSVVQLDGPACPTEPKPNPFLSGCSCIMPCTAAQHTSQLSCPTMTTLAIPNPPQA